MFENNLIISYHSFGVELSLSKSDKIYIVEDTSIMGMGRRGFLASILAGVVVVPMAVSSEIKEGLVDLVETGADYLVSQAEAEEKIHTYTDIGEYYDSGTPSDEMPGARRGPKASVKVKVFGFPGTEWYEHYFDNPKYSSDLQAIFRELDGQRIIIHSPEHEGETVVFDFDKFHEFNLENRKHGKWVGFYYDLGFMDFGDTSTYERIVLPIPIDLTQKIQKLYI